MRLASCYQLKTDTMKTYQKFAIAPLALFLALSPALASAKENGLKLGLEANAKARVEKEDERKEDRGMNEADRHCLKAFGHFIAKGFVKNKGEVEIDWKDCFVPPGIIAKKVKGRATTTVDVIAPVISSIKTFVGSTTARILWATNENASSTVTYGAANASTTATVSANGSLWAKLHTVVLDNLSASTTYNFRISATDKSGNSTTSAQAFFTTK